jgi:hypothetical protein
MDITAIAKCDRCGTGFIFEIDPARAALPSIDFRKANFDNKIQIVRSRYLKTLEINRNMVADKIQSKVVAFCEKCNADYWANFERAALILSDFWAEPPGVKLS